MSLYGSGRRDGVLAVLLLGIVTLVVYGIAAARGLVVGDDAFLQTTMRDAQAALAIGHTPLPAAVAAAPPHAPILYPPWWLLCLSGIPALGLCVALHAALAGGGFYRFLRAQGRSRYSAFLGGAVYGLGLSVTARSDDLPALAAAAWLPLLLEAGARLRRPGPRPWAKVQLGATASVPLLAGGQAVALVAVLFGFLFALAGLRRVERGERRALLRSIVQAVGITVLLTAPAWLAGLDRLAGRQHADVDPPVVPLLELVPASATVFLVLLGTLRFQRHVAALPWLLVAAAGAAGAYLLPPAFAWLGAGDATEGAPLLLLQVALPVISAAALDDFLDLPLRRAYAVPVASLLLLLAATAASAGVLLLAEGHPLAPACRVLLPVLLTGLGLGVLFHLWRPFGMPAFKTILAAIVLGGLAVQALLELAAPSTRSEQAVVAASMQSPAGHDRITFDVGGLALLPAAPLAETHLPLAVALLPSLQVADLPAGFRPRRSAASLRTLQVLPTAATYEADMADGQGLLVLAGPWLPGWSALLDGERVPVLRTSTDQRAVVLPPGRHRVQFGYRSRSLLLGLPLFALGLAALLLAAITARRA